MDHQILDIFMKNIHCADNNVPMDRIVVSGDGSKHRKKKERGDLCGLCCFGPHEPQPIDEAPVFSLVEQNASEAVVEGNDPKKLFRFFANFRAKNENGGFTAMTMHTAAVHSRAHVIPVPGGAVAVGKYASQGGGEIFVDIQGHELAILATRLRRDTRFVMNCVSAETAGMQRVFSLRSFAMKKITSAALPRVTISEWVPWHEVTRLGDHFSRKGCYMLGRFSGVPDHEELVPAELVYVGITEDRDLRTRLRELYTSATTHANGHSGGCEFRRVCVPDQAKKYLDWPLPDDTYVRVISADCPKSKAHAEAIRDVEARLIAQYAFRHGRLPLCNRKA